MNLIVITSSNGAVWLLKQEHGYWTGEHMGTSETLRAGTLDMLLYNIVPSIGTFNASTCGYCGRPLQADGHCPTPLCPGLP